MSDIRYMTPRDLAKLVRRVRRTSFYLSMDATLYVEMPMEGEGVSYRPTYTSLKVTQKQALEVLKDWSETAERRLEKGDDACLVRVNFGENWEFRGKSHACMFIG